MTEIHDNLRTPAFLEMWEQWKQHRQEIRHPIKPTTERLQLKKLSEAGVVAAIEMMSYSIEQGYIGLFAPSKKNGVSTMPIPADIWKPILNAYREVFGPDAELPGTWESRMNDLIKSGGTVRLKQLANQDHIRKGLRMSQEARGTFGVGWVERAIDDSAAERVSHTRRFNGYQQGNIEAAANIRQIEAEQQEALAEFATVTQETRRKYMKLAGKQFPMVHKPELLERLAAFAWKKDQQQEEIPDDSRNED